MKDAKDPSYDPKYRQIVVRLEALPAKSFAVTVADNGYVLWYYDPRNRITSPGIAVFDDAAQLVAAFAASLVAEYDDDPKIRETLERAARLAEMARLEFLAKACEDGGYLSGETKSRIPRDKEKAALFREEALTLKSALRKQTPSS